MPHVPGRGRSRRASGPGAPAAAKSEIPMIPEKKKHAVGVDIGGSHICSAVVDLATGALCGEPLSSPVDSSAGAARIVAAWAGNIRRTVEAFAGGVQGAGFAFPGPFDYRQGISLVRGVNKFDSLYGLHVSESLFPLLRGAGIEAFRYVNDAAAFALGECLSGAASDAGRVMAVTLGTGVGSGFVCRHRLVVSGDEVPANGWIYCLPFGDSIADELFSTRGIVERYRSLTGCTVAGAREVAERCPGEPAARALFETYGDDLARFVAPLLRRFRADMLVLGGNISRAWPLFGPALGARLSAEGVHVGVRTSALPDHAALIGAASLFYDC